MILQMSQSSPRNDLKRLQAEWYERLKQDGFEDIEDTSLDERPLKRWSGAVSLDGKQKPVCDLFGFQDPGTEIQSSFPSKRYGKEEALLNHAEFDDICSSVCGHGNHRLVASQVKEIWELYLEGKTNRAISKETKVNHVTVYRTITSLTEWANGMGEEQEESKVVVRDYDMEHDAAMLFSTWRNALWYDNPNRDESKNHAFFRSCSRLIKTIIANPYTRVYIACLSDDPSLILGTAVLNKDNLVWVYVKADYRGKGIATLLTKGFATVSNPSTIIGKAIVRDKQLKVKDGRQEN